MGRTLLSDALESDSGMPHGSACLQLLKVKVNLKGIGHGCPPPTLVVLLRGYRRDLGELERCGYIQPMTLVLMMVGLAFGLLYVAVVAEERQMQEATKLRKR